jgi:cation diffusion facilitator family transporter
MAFQIHKNDKINTQWWILILGLIIMAAKFYAFYLTKSNTILSDALESIVNIIAGSLGLYSLYLSSKPRDFDHPYGHGKVEFITSAIEGTMIIVAGIMIIYKSIYSFIHPHAIQELGIGIILIAISGIINYLLGAVAVTKGKKKNSLALESSGVHLKTDAYTTLGILLGLLLIYFTKLEVLDNIIAFLIALFIIYHGYAIVKKSISGIMDEADFQLNKHVISYINANRKPEWIDVHNFRIIKYGEVIHIDCHMTMPWYNTLQESHDSMKLFEDCLQNSVSNPVETFIHIDPCVPRSCKICEVKNCPERQFKFEHKIEWKLENITKNQKHHYLEI